MKKYLKIAAGFLAAGLCGGVFYREFSKYHGLQGQFSVLGLVHVHFLVLGVLAVLIFGLVSDRLKPTGKLPGRGLLCYVIGTAGTGIMLFVRGLIEMLARVNGNPVSAGLNGAVSGIAGLCHILLGVGVTCLFVAWLRACKD